MQEVAQKLMDHHAKMTNIFKEMYGDVRLVPLPKLFLPSIRLVWFPRVLSVVACLLGANVSSPQARPAVLSALIFGQACAGLSANHLLGKLLFILFFG